MAVYKKNLTSSERKAFEEAKFALDSLDVAAAIEDLGHNVEDVEQDVFDKIVEQYEFLNNWDWYENATTAIKDFLG